MADAKTGGFRVLPSYYEAIRDLPDEVRLEIYDAIMDYGFGSGNGKELSPCAKSIFLLIVPTLERSIRFEEKQAENGSKGGRPKNPNKTQAEPKENPNKTQAEPKRNLDVAIDVDVDSDIDIAFDVEGGCARARDDARDVRAHAHEGDTAVQFAENVVMTNAEHRKLLDTYGPADTARLIQLLDDYKAMTGKQYKNDYRAILSWVVDKLHEERARAGGKQQQTYSGGTTATAAMDNRAAREMREILAQEREGKP